MTAKQPSGPLEALEHMLQVYKEWPDESGIVTATQYLRPQDPYSGLTLGDLRRLLSAHASALAEEIRAEQGHLVIDGEPYWETEAGMQRAANLIDPRMPS